MDYSICNALGYGTNGITEALVSYDIACQWNKNFGKRVSDSQYLNLPDCLDIIPSVGKMHLGAHIPECFPFYSLNFIHGAGQQDGEIIETLWSSLNKVSGSIRAMSKAHRHEVLDDYMRDSNWKKLVRMGEISYTTFDFFIIFNCDIGQSLKTKHKAAIKGLKLTQDAFEGLDGSVSKNLRNKWIEAEKEAMDKRGEHLKIYQVQIVEG
jgi:hypothetical protein